MEFEGKVAVISGAAQGLGKTIAEKMLAEGACIAALDINEETLKAAYEGVEHVLTCRCDVTCEDDWKAAIDKVVSTFGRIDILVNNAAIFVFKNLEDITLQEFNKAMDVCVTGTVLGTKYAIAELKKTCGNIVNISSVSSRRSGAIDAGQAAYGAAKSAVNGFNRYCAVAFAPDNVRVNAVLPGPFMTPALKGLLEMDPHALEPMRAILPPGYAEASDIADAVLFLAGSHARCITGCELVVDNGVMAN